MLVATGLELTGTGTVSTGVTEIGSTGTGSAGMTLANVTWGQSMKILVVGIQSSIATELGLTGSGSMGMEAVGVGSLSVPVAVVRARGATSPFFGVMADLGSARSGCEGVGCGLAKGNGALPDPLVRPSMSGLASKAVVRTSLAWAAVSLVIEAVAGSLDGEDAGCMGVIIVVLQGTAFADVVQMGSTITSTGVGLPGGIGAGCVWGSIGLSPSASLTSVAQ